MAESEGTRANHFTNLHPRWSSKYKNMLRPERAVDMQTFCGGHRAKQWFQVCEELAAPPNPKELRSTPAAPDELLEAFLKGWKPAVQGAVPIDSVKDVQPWIHYNGWASHVSKYDPRMLCGLVEPPDDESPLRRIVDAAIREFKADQATLAKTPHVYRTEIMDEGTGCVTRCFLVGP